jgi:hypothetical protein
VPQRLTLLCTSLLCSLRLSQETFVVAQCEPRAIWLYRIQLPNGVSQFPLADYLHELIRRHQRREMRYYTALVLKNLAIEWRKKADRVGAKRVRKFDR